MGETMSRKRGRRGSPESWSVDGHVGQRLRMRRTLLGMSQEKLGEAIGLTFQQVQKYERGANRISAGTLYRLGQVLGVRVDYFFDEFDDDGSAAPTRAVEVGGRSGEGITRREAKLLRLWRSASSSVTDELLSLLGSLVPHAEEDAETEVAPVPAPAAPPIAAKPAPAPRGRRRHGAVWDPADITASVRATSRNK